MSAVYRDSGSISTEDKQVTIRGWVQEIRNLGGISFVIIRDRFGTVQVTLPKKKTDPAVFEGLTSVSRESVVSVQRCEGQPDRAGS